MEWTEKQMEARKILSSDTITHVLLEGGSRSGKTFLAVRQIVARALKAPGSRHVILRHRFNACKTAVALDTYPKVLSTCFPGVAADMDKTDWYSRLPGGSEVWFGGLDDKERTEKILGKEYATIFPNEVSQISYQSYGIAVTRLAQKCAVLPEFGGGYLVPKMIADCNPPSKAHWIYKVFHLCVDPETKQPLPNKARYAHFRLNPRDNQANISADYLESLAALPARLRKRFLDGEYADATPNQLFREEDIDTWRVLDGVLPDMVRVVVAVDPSGAGDTDNADNDAIGIVVAGLGTDGNAYILEDCTVKAGPATWGNVATTAFDRHNADCVVGETNYGGAMVQSTIQAARRNTPFRAVTASRGKCVRAEPISALYEKGKVRHVGNFFDLEDELTQFSTAGYLGSISPNRADACIWALTELFQGIVAGPKKNEPLKINRRYVV